MIFYLVSNSKGSSVASRLSSHIEFLDKVQVLPMGLLGCD